MLPRHLISLSFILALLGFIVLSNSENWAIASPIVNGIETHILNYPRVHAFEHLSYALTYGGVLLLVTGCVIATMTFRKKSA